jgi:hypothetical protein
MYNLRVFVAIFVQFFCGILCQNAMFDDSVRYDISWAGPLRSSQQVYIVQREFCICYILLHVDNICHMHSNVKFVFKKRV